MHFPFFAYFTCPIMKSIQKEDIMSRKKIETKDPIKEKQEELTNELTKLFEAIEAFSRLATVFEELNERIRKHRKKVESLGIELAELMGLENPTEK